MENKNLINEAVSQNVDIDLNFSETRKKRIRIDGDDNRIIELNTADMDIMKRLDKLASRMEELSTKVADLKYDENAEERTQTDELKQTIELLDTEMRSIIDDLFQSPVSAVCAQDGTMWDMFNGRYRYEIIIEQLIGLYANNIEVETKKTMERIKKHTNKYLTQDHKRKG